MSKKWDRCLEVVELYSVTEVCGYDSTNLITTFELDPKSGFSGLLVVLVYGVYFKTVRKSICSTENVKRISPYLWVLDGIQCLR